MHNEVEIHAPAAIIWANLIDALQRPNWYANSAEVKLLAPEQSQLEANSRFTWKTFNLPVESQVHDFVPDKLLGWYGKGKTA